MKPIRFNTEMVKAILDNRKTQTRRLIKEKLLNEYSDYDDWCKSIMPSGFLCQRSYEKDYFLQRTKYQVGDILYVQETWNKIDDDCGTNWFYQATDDMNACDDDGNAISFRWRSLTSMPKEAARIFLKVTAVMVERVQDITQSDLTKEGFEHNKYLSGDGAFIHYSELWDSIYGNWNDNPWVWVYEFERCKNEEVVNE